MWVYSQTTGILAKDGQKVDVGYSGHAAGLNCPDLQAVHKVGPIPQGFYEIGAPVDTETHGPFVLPLQPDPDNQMFGRDGFLIHGDRIGQPAGSASEGCIILARATREKIWNSGDRTLQVVKNGG